ncbi:hypothetical protein [Azospirillum agricola]|uniref:hypothetical protein n=1 Tax=Azospirillum agricola TaxID=1720247 RepID=UPI000A0EF07B|nr:hypothetical protein [Azospirillum agricola]SMH62526.1 hypothetical protein SAMN02982994_6329 [Azospirillum lipoferum]
MSAGNAAVLDENLALTATLSGGNWARSVENLLDPTVKEVTARCVSGKIDDAWFDIVFPDRTKFDTIVLAGGTLHRAAGYRLTWYSDPVDRSPGAILVGGPSAPVLPVYPRAGRAAAASYFQKNWWRLGPSERDLAGKTRQLVTRPPNSPRCRALRVEIDNKGFPLDLGHLFVTRAFRPEWPHDWGLVIEPVNSSPVDTTPGGRRIVDVRPAPRRKTVRFVDLSEDEAMHFFDMGQGLGSSGPLLMVEDITQSRHLWRRTWLATLEQGGISVTQNEGDLWSTELKLLEIIG